jgi:crossover junction endodeoxyribonuclease RusA
MTTATKKLKKESIQNSVQSDPNIHMFLALPYPPSLNSLYVPYRGRMIISKAARQYHQDFQRVLNQLGHPGTATGFIEADVWVCPPDRRGRDIDNVLKALFDAMQKAGVYENDYQIKALRNLTMDYWPYPDGAVIVKLTKLSEHNYEREGNGELLDQLRAAKLKLGMPVKPAIPRPEPLKNVNQ